MSQLSCQPGGVSLAALLVDAEFVGTTDIRVSGCSCDSRVCRPGDLFVALSGAEYDGHDFAQQASARGATAILAERALPFGLPTCIVPDSRAAALNDVAAVQRTEGASPALLQDCAENCASEPPHFKLIVNDSRKQHPSWLGRTIRDLIPLNPAG